MCLDLYTSKEKAAILSVQMGHKQQKECEYFYMFLNTLEDIFDTEVERKQFTEIKTYIN